mgnify:CR=1 FL=1
MKKKLSDGESKEIVLCSPALWFLRFSLPTRLLLSSSFLFLSYAVLAFLFYSCLLLSFFLLLLLLFSSWRSYPVHDTCRRTRASSRPRRRHPRCSSSITPSTRPSPIRAASASPRLVDRAPRWCVRLSLVFFPFVLIHFLFSSSSSFCSVVQLRLLGHTKEGYGLSWNCNIPGHILSASDDTVRPAGLNFVQLTFSFFFLSFFLFFFFSFFFLSLMPDHLPVGH